jgi:ribosomal protein S3AE
MSIRIPKSQLKQIVKESIKEILKEGSNPDLRTFVKTCVQELMAEGKLNGILFIDKAKNLHELPPADSE